MASQEHKELALFIKGVHHSLRKLYRKLGHEESWKNHCTQTALLEKYASSMHLLATKYWDNGLEDPLNHSKNRIHWIVMKCVKYFLNGGKEAELIKEMQIIEKLGRSNVQIDKADSRDKIKVRLLDVGSCYNPFEQYPLFDVISIDIAPATSDVWKCDFLSVTVSDYGQDFESLKQVITINEIPANCFDLVIFSLFLEYIPCPRERYKCCQKAYRLLKPEGLLFIITPDSKHATANAAIMKQWRIALGKLGFQRIYYEKLQHLHCMAYRKTVDQGIPVQWASKIAMKLKTSLSDEDNISLYIPQDHNCYSEEEVDSDSDTKTCKRCESDNAVLAEMFSELPSDFE